MVLQYGNEGDDIVYGSQGTQAATGTMGTDGQTLVVDLGAGDDQFFGEDGGAFNLVRGGLGDDKILGGNNFGTGDMVANYGANTLAYGSQILVGGDLLPTLEDFGTNMD